MDRLQVERDEHVEGAGLDDRTQRRHIASPRDGDD